MKRFFQVGTAVFAILLATASVQGRAKPFASGAEAQKIHDHLLPQIDRVPLAGALAELVAEGAFTEAKALELARMYLHDNAAHLYGGMK